MGLREPVVTTSGGRCRTFVGGPWVGGQAAVARARYVGRVLFDVQVSTRGGWSVIAVTGELDLANVPQVRRAVIGTLAIGRSYLVFDLTEVDFIDSSGLGVVLGAVRRARAIGGDVRVVVRHAQSPANAESGKRPEPDRSDDLSRPRIIEVFESTGLDRILSMYPSLDEAVHDADAQDAEVEASDG